jgi:hypothetical protein
MRVRTWTCVNVLCIQVSTLYVRGPLRGGLPLGSMATHQAAKRPSQCV